MTDCSSCCIYREFKDEFCVLEFVRAEKLDDGTEGDGPWFLDILRLKSLGNWGWINLYRETVGSLSKHSTGYY